MNRKAFVFAVFYLRRIYGINAIIGGKTGDLCIRDAHYFTCQATTGR
jgi:hypothetical protein